MTKGECGCDEKSNSEFLPGHDQKLRASFQRKVGGLLSLRDLVEVVKSYIWGGN